MNQWNRIILILLVAILVAGLVYNLGLLGGGGDAPAPTASEYPTMN
jgi:hypothetical protein